MKRETTKQKTRTICRNCGKYLDDSGLKVGEFIQHCVFQHLVGNAVNVEKELNRKKSKSVLMKGGIEMATKKKTKQDSTPAQIVHVSKTETRVNNANKVIEFMDSLDIDDAEKRKVCSRVYGIISKKLKN